MKERQVRCLNCFVRVPVSQRVKEITCPKCQVKYVLGWRDDQPKIMGLPKG